MVLHSARSEQEQNVPLLIDAHDGIDTLNVSGTEVNFTWKSEAWVLSSIGFPVGVSSFCRLLMAVTDISVLGRLPNGTIYLAAASMSYVVMDITGTFPSTAADALNALCSQADGAKNPKMIGRWLKIGLCIVILMCPPIMLLWLMTGTILESLGCSPEIADLANTFALWSMFGLIPNTVYYAIRQYFQAQHIVMPALYTNMLFVGVNLFLNVALVHGLGPFPGLGFIGSPIATSLSRTLQLVVFILYTCTWKKLHRTTWPDGSFWDCFSKRHVSEYFKQTIPTMIGNAIEQWQFEAVTLMASRLSVVDLATQSAVFNIFYTFHCITFGLSKAITCRVGYYLGANQPRYARFTSLLAIWLCLGISVCIAAILYLIRNVIGHLYSLDPAIWADSASLMTFLSITYIGVSLLMALISILFGQGRPFPVAVVGGLCAWVVSLPAAYTFSFVFSFGLVGLWMGLSCGYFLSAILLGAIVYRSDWNDCAIQAVSRSTIVYD